MAAVLEPALKAARVHTVVQALGQPSGDGYDIVISEGAVSAVPDAWIQALKPGGRLAVVERDGPIGHARLFVRAQSGAVSRLELFDAAPEMLAGFEKRPTFAL